MFVLRITSGLFCHAGIKFGIIIISFQNNVPSLGLSSIINLVPKNMYVGLGGMVAL